MIEKLTNMYPISKTLQFSLIPVGKTEKYFEERFMQDESNRDAAYPQMKKYMDLYHKDFIETCLSKVKPDKFDIKEYAALYSKSLKTSEDRQQMKSIEASLRKVISTAFTDPDEYDVLMKPGDFIKKLLPEYLDKEGYLDSEGLETLSYFKKFGTFFTGYTTNRENMYVADEKSTAISYRCINQNLPKFLDNVNTFKNKILPFIDASILEQLNKDISAFGVFEVKDYFSEDFYIYVLSQSGIDAYNQMIGGYSTQDGKKIKGLNEYINLYNQTLPKENRKKDRIPVLKPLYKQILSDRDTVSYIPETFNSDPELTETIKTFCAHSQNDGSLGDVIQKLTDLFTDLSSFDKAGIMCAKNMLTNISQKEYGSWEYLSRLWEQDYDLHKSEKKKNEKYYEERQKTFKNIKKFSVEELEALAGDDRVSRWISKEAEQLNNKYRTAFEEAEKLFDSPDLSNRSLRKDKNAVTIIKALLDAIKEIEYFAKAFIATGADGMIDEAFYGEFAPLFEAVCQIDHLYDKVRNYVTAKPYSKDKMKITFNSSSFLTGWGQKFDTKSAHIIQKSEKEYYLMVIDSTLKEDEEDLLFSAETDADLIIYKKQKPDNKNVPRLFIRSKGDNFAPAVGKYNLPINDVIDIYDKGLFKTGHAKKNPSEQKAALTKLIDYFKTCFLKHEDYSCFDFSWKDSTDYNTINEFYEDTLRACYKLQRKGISFSNLLTLAEEGRVYLFRIYSKDFSEYSHGTPNLHTMYFTALFSDENLRNYVFQLLGEAEIFYRKASIKKDDQVVHKAGEAIKNKNKLNPKTESTFKYDLIKDKRYTQNQFSVHIPIKMNLNADNNLKVNDAVRKAIRGNDTIPYVIGIDRGERNLVYITVIDGAGNIVEERSLNEIISKYKTGDTETEYKVDYQALLVEKETAREKARKEWSTIENIKELKEGYISQVINEICKLAIKYNAVIALEDLNSGFKNSRKKVERQVYDKFETMLKTKLEYLIDKKTDINQPGGLHNAYQLTDPKHNSTYQDGIMFFVPAWLTSKIDPVTGFACMIYPKYTSISAAREFIGAFDCIEFDDNEKCSYLTLTTKNLKGQTLFTEKNGDCILTGNEFYMNVTKQIITNGPQEE